MNICEQGHRDRAAGILARACEGAINEVTVGFANCYDKDLVNIQDYVANPRGKGYGTKGMQFICNVADKESINLLLRVYSEEKERLIKFYERFGFKVINPAEMMRCYKR